VKETVGEGGYLITISIAEIVQHNCTVMIIRHWWNKTNKAKPKNYEKNLSRE
jgi:hypothetical protein